MPPVSQPVTSHSATSQSTSQSISQSIRQSTSQSTCQSTSQSTSQSTIQSTSHPNFIHSSVSQPTTNCHLKMTNLTEMMLLELQTDDSQLLMLHPPLEVPMDAEFQVRHRTSNLDEMVLPSLPRSLSCTMGQQQQASDLFSSADESLEKRFTHGSVTLQGITAHRMV